jgi:hypothetical protein
LTLVLVGCGDEATTETGSTATVRVAATNAPAAADGDAGASAALASSAVVSVSAVYLVPAGQENAQIQLLNETPLVLDLMHLDGDLPATLAEATVPAGRYSQLRIVIDDATVTLAEGLFFEGGETVRELMVPSGAQTGIKVNILGPIEAAAGSWSSLLVDFDVSANFVVQGDAGTPAGIKDVLFKPVLNEVSRTSLPSEDEM